MPNFTVLIDKEADAKNWNQAGNPRDTIYGFDSTKTINPTILAQIQGKTEQEALNILVPFLDKVYEKNDNFMEHKKLYETWWKEHQEYIKTMEKIVGKEIPTETIYIKIVTAGMHRYFAKYRMYMQSTLNNMQIIPPEQNLTSSLHEILHLMVHHYYEDYIKEQGLSNQEFHDLKEAQTVILNESYAGILINPDTGYQDHKDIREKLAIFRKTIKNFDEFVDYGIKVMKERRNNHSNSLVPVI